MRTILILLICISVLFVNLISGCFDSDTSKYNEKSAIELPKMTEIEAKEIVDNIAKDWKEESQLYTVIGGYEGWEFWYRYYYMENNSKNISRTKLLFIFIFDNGTIGKKKESETIGLINHIENWTINSNEAMKIAKNDPDVGKFLEKYPKVAFRDIWLDMESTSTPVWYFRWEHDLGYDSSEGNFYEAEIKINATSGEVIESFAIGI